MSDDIDAEPILGTLILKIPFFVLGVAMGMAVVWVALMWVPDAAEPILRAIKAG